MIIVIIIHNQSVGLLGAAAAALPLDPLEVARDSPWAPAYKYFKLH